MRRVSLVLTLSVFATPALAQDWPQWRGPSRDGHVPKVSAPAEWPASYERAWRVELGEGYASPVVADGRVFVHSRRDPKEVLTALDLATGKVLWRQEYDAAYEKNQYAVKMGRGPNATPLVAGGRVFTFGSTAVLIAWDAETGRQLWQNDYSKLVDFSKLFCGTAASPILVDGALIVQAGSDIHSGVIHALDPATGEPKWEWKGPGPGYASPIVVETGGTKHVVTLTNSSVVGLDAATGRQLWTTPFPDDWHENIVTPVWTGTHLIVSGTRQGTRAYRLVREDGAWTAVEAWHQQQLSMYMSSPVFADGTLYGLSDKRKGHFFALDAATGSVKWATEGRDGANASLLLTPSHLVALTTDATLLVARLGAPELAIEQRYDVADAETWAAPVVLGRDLIVRDATGVMRLRGR